MSKYIQYCVAHTLLPATECSLSIASIQPSLYTFSQSSVITTPTFLCSLPERSPPLSAYLCLLAWLNYFQHIHPHPGHNISYITKYIHDRHTTCFNKNSDECMVYSMSLIYMFCLALPIFCSNTRGNFIKTHTEQFSN